jgi:hypothetical protein
MRHSYYAVRYSYENRFPPWAHHCGSTLAEFEREQRAMRAEDLWGVTVTELGHEPVSEAKKSWNSAGRNKCRILTRRNRKENSDNVLGQDGRVKAFVHEVKQ